MFSISEPGQVIMGIINPVTASDVRAEEDVAPGPCAAEPVQPPKPDDPDSGDVDTFAGDACLRCCGGDLLEPRCTYRCTLRLGRTGDCCCNRHNLLLAAGEMKNKVANFPSALWQVRDYLEDTIERFGQGSLSPEYRRPIFLSGFRLTKAELRRKSYELNWDLEHLFSYTTDGVIEYPHIAINV